MSSTQTILQADWQAPVGVQAVCTTRLGGCSRGVYASFNLGAHVGDDPEAVSANRRRLRSLLALEAEPCWLTQVHGTRIVHAVQANAGQRADGSYATAPGQVCCVMTADCLPVVLYSLQTGRLAVVHAGWRGLAAGIVENALTLIGGSGDRIVAWLGPAIGPESFEVGQDVVDTFTGLSSQHAAAFRQTGEHRWMADLYMLARQKLAARGVVRVDGGNCCTMSDDRLFYSYRRDRVTGRMATLAWLT